MHIGVAAIFSSVHCFLVCMETVAWMAVVVGLHVSGKRMLLCRGPVEHYIHHVVNEHRRWKVDLAG